MPRCECNSPGGTISFSHLPRRSTSSTVFPTTKRATLPRTMREGGTLAAMIFLPRNQRRRLRRAISTSGNSGTSPRSFGFLGMSTVYLTVKLSRFRFGSVRDDDLKLEDLVKRSGVSARTVRYYVQRGLLP